MTPVADVPLKIMGVLGETKLQEEAFLPVLELLSSNGYAPKTGAELMAGPPEAEPCADNAGAGIVNRFRPCVPHAKSNAEQAGAADQQCPERLLDCHAEYSSDTMFLASPLIGGAVGVTRFQQLFLKSIMRGRKTPAEWAADAWGSLDAQGQRLIKDGKTVERKEENLSALLDMAADFHGKRLPIMKALGIAQ